MARVVCTLSAFFVFVLLLLRKSLHMPRTCKLLRCTTTHCIPSDRLKHFACCSDESDQAQINIFNLNKFLDQFLIVHGRWGRMAQIKHNWWSDNISVCFGIHFKSFWQIISQTNHRIQTTNTTTSMYIHIWEKGPARIYWKIVPDVVRQYNINRV